MSRTTHLNDPLANLRYQRDVAFNRLVEVTKETRKSVSPPIELAVRTAEFLIADEDLRVAKIGVSGAAISFIHYDEVDLPHSEPSGPRAGRSPKDKDVEANAKKHLERDGWRQGKDKLWRNNRFGGSFNTRNAMMRLGMGYGIDFGDADVNIYRHSANRVATDYKGRHYEGRNIEELLLNILNDQSSLEASEAVATPVSPLTEGEDARLDYLNVVDRDWTEEETIEARQLKRRKNLAGVIKYCCCTWDEIEGAEGIVSYCRECPLHGDAAIKEKDEAMNDPAPPDSVMSVPQGPHRIDWKPLKASSPFNLATCTCSWKISSVNAEQGSFSMKEISPDCPIHGGSHE